MEENCAEVPDGLVDLHDVATHRSAWRNAIILAREAASDLSEDPDDDCGYWDHELCAFDRTFHILAACRQSGAGVPEGMVPWLGGDREPEDWDSRSPILWADRTQWFPRIDQEPFINWKCVIAYTPLSSPTSGADTLAEAVRGIDDDFMTSEHHHPGYVLIPTARFDRIVAALSRGDAK